MSLRGEQKMHSFIVSDKIRMKDKKKIVKAKAKRKLQHRKAKLVMPNYSPYIKDNIRVTMDEYQIKKTPSEESHLMQQNYQPYQTSPQLLFSVPVIAPQLVQITYSTALENEMQLKEDQNYSGSFSIIPRGNLPSISTLPFPYLV